MIILAAAIALCVRPLEILAVGDGKPFARIEDAVKAASPGTEIDVYPSTAGYKSTAVKIKLSGLTIKGVGKPVTTTPTERRISATLRGNRLFLPALIVPATALAGTLFLKPLKALVDDKPLHFQCVYQAYFGTHTGHVRCGCSREVRSHRHGDWEGQNDLKSVGTRRPRTVGWPSSRGAISQLELR